MSLMKKVAILYDFDKTLSTQDMQEFGFLKDLGFEDSKEFWALSAQRAHTHRMDPILSYLYEILVQAKRHNLKITEALLRQYGPRIEYYPGVDTWFERINALGASYGLHLEHYILSSGLSEMIEASRLAPYITKIFACAYLYDELGNAVWPKVSVNYTLKTQYLFRINKGVLDIFDDEELNRYQPEDQRPIPFQRMIYIGDGLTDVPSMKLVKNNGGLAIGVYPLGQEYSAISQQLLNDQRVDAIAPADYQAGSALESVLHQHFIRINHEIAK